MKKLFLLATAFAFTLAVSAQNTTKADDVAKFSVESYDFGKIKQGVPVTYSFEIKNMSDKPIVIESASATCGCTVPEKPEEPIEPGKTAKIKVQYNAAAVNPFTKDIHVRIAGITEHKTLHITGEVLTAEAYEAYMKEKANTPAPAKQTDKEKPKN